MDTQIFNPIIDVKVLNTTSSPKSFMLYRENFTYTLPANSGIAFTTSDVNEGIYYSLLNSTAIQTGVSSEDSVIAYAGTITDGTFSYGDTTYEVLQNGSSFNVFGTLPINTGTVTDLNNGTYIQLLIKNPQITSSSALPSGNIATVYNSDGDMIKEYSNTAFQADGSLAISINFAIGQTVTVDIEWESGVTDTYTITAPTQTQPAVSITSIILPSQVTLLNTSTSVVNYVPYKENFIETIQPEDSIVFEVEDINHYLYYQAQQTSNLKVSFEEV